MRKALRSLLAVLGGVIATVGTVMVATLLGVLLFFGGDLDAEPTSAWMATNLAYSALAAVLGGWLAGRISGRAPVLHGLAVAAVLLAMGLAGGGEGAGATGAPAWYGSVLLYLGPGGAALGALLHLFGGGAPGDETPQAIRS